jgi:hypothetical protein
MDYQRIYQQFIADRKAKEPECYRGKTKNQRIYLGAYAGGCYREHHHVLPKSLGGNNKAENMLSLTARDHFFAHLLLAQIHDGNQWKAVLSMSKMINESSTPRREISNSRLVEKARIKSAEVNSLSRKGIKTRSLRGPKITIKNKDGRSFTGYRRDLFELTGISDSAMSQLVSRKRGCTYSGWYLYEDEMLKSKDSKKKNGVKLSTSRENVWNIRKFLCVETGSIFNGAAAAAKFAGLSSGRNIIAVCSGKRNHAGGYRWKYA